MAGPSICSYPLQQEQGDWQASLALPFSALGRHPLPPPPRSAGIWKGRRWLEMGNVKGRGRLEDMLGVGRKGPQAWVWIRWVPPKSLTPLSEAGARSAASDGGSLTLTIFGELDSGLVGSGWSNAAPSRPALRVQPVAVSPSSAQQGTPPHLCPGRPLVLG